MSSDFSINGVSARGAVKVESVVPANGTQGVKAENSETGTGQFSTAGNPARENQSTSSQSSSIGEEQLVKAIERALKQLQGKATTFEYNLHEETKQLSIKVKDRETGEIIREIPPEKNLDLLAKLWEMAGIIIDERR